ncbi:hypothetical protein DI487_15935 [Flavobacterium sediminis]|uniref:Uncharacterized protein n=1 Tax=Flavobacterium sediminis TaxID=2201181 RepID=A0A2U8QYR0_9FLAO|nr:hypothetical protein [Flavobacterium sediminis]AWM15201.1 hypothetical protein DI487_15935 [Flavobacterium sediminis]
MGFLKKYYKANSIIESVMALTIISICIYIAILVYANVFTPKTSMAHYSKQNILSRQFYELQLQEELPNTAIISVEENWLNTNLKEVTVQYKDSIDKSIQKQFYIYIDE